MARLEQNSKEQRGSFWIGFMRTVIVTGASKGIGAAVVRSLRSRGCRVVGVARNEAKLKLLGNEKQGTGVFEYVVGDVCDKAVLERAVQLAIMNNNSLDGLVINAG
jgi:NADP-dependent 3-hydroxy acid dehydrogenase YdfG